MVIHKEISAGFIAIAIGVVVVASAISIILPNILNERIDITIGDAIFKTSVAINNADRISLMDKTENLDKKDAILLVYPKISRWSINLQDIDVPIDIVWLDQHKRVVDISKNVNMNSFEDYRIIPDNLSKYILILSSGATTSESIGIGRFASFIIDEEAVE